MLEYISDIVLELVIPFDMFKANRKFQILLQHYPGKAKINVNIPNTTSPELKSSSPPPLSSSSIPAAATTERKRSPTAPIPNGDNNSITGQKKKVLISIKVNRSKCSNLGPYLDPRKVIEHIPDQFGLGPIHQVVRKSVQSLVDVSFDQKAVFGMLRQGEGRVIITASFEDKIQNVRLPAMENEAAVIDFLEILFEELRCEPFYEVFKKDFSSDEQKHDPEDEPLKNGSLKRKGSNDNVTLTFSNSSLPAGTSSAATSTEAFPPTLTAAATAVDEPDSGPSSTPKIPRLSSIDPASFYNGSNNKNHKSSGQKPRGRPLGSKNVLPPKAKPKSSPKHAPTPPSSGGNSLLTSPTKNKSGPIYQNAHKLHLAQEKAKALAAAAATMTSRTSAPTLEPIAAMPKLEPEQLPKDPTLWTIDNVISHLSHLDSALRPHVEMFRSHEIDGNALLLLTSDMMMKYMGMKLGPALKICNIINMIQGKKHQQIPK